MPVGERIHKRLAEAGVGSRREVERWIGEGRVTVNGRPATLGQAITERDTVRVDGRRVSLRRGGPRRVLAYKKRAGQIVTRHDPQGRDTVFRSLPALESGRWIAVGRLDVATSGLLLMTNDGELARRLMHPSFRVSREYSVRVSGPIDDGLLHRLREGVALDDGTAKFDRLQSAPGENRNRWFHVAVSEGRNRLVRRLFESQGCSVSRLIRTRYGPVALGRGVRSGGWRELDAAELRALAQAVDLSKAGSKPTPGARAGRPARRRRPSR